MPLLKRLRVLAAAIETTPGTAETLDAGDATYNVYNPIIQPSIEMGQRERQGSFGRLTAIAGQRVGTATFMTDLEWDGTATEPAWADAFLPACGFVKSGGTYTATDEAPGTNVKTLTIGCYVNGVKKQLRGCMGNFRVVLPTGRNAMIEWTFQGVWDTPTDTAILAPTYTTSNPVRATGAVAFGSTLCVSEMAFDAGNVLTPRECQGDIAGVNYFLVTDRQPIATADPESALVASADHYGDIINQTVQGLTYTISTAGTGNDNIVFALPAAQVQNNQEGDRNGIVTDQITWQGNYHSSGAMYITFTSNA